MNTQNENPYQNPGPAPTDKPVDDKGTVLAGFFIGWGLMIGGSTLTGFAITLISAFVSAIGGYDNFIFQGLALLSLLLPIAILVAAMVWFGKKGKSKTVKGIAAAIISAIALAVLLVAACFGIFAMGGGGFH